MNNEISKLNENANQQKHETYYDNEHESNFAKKYENQNVNFVIAILKIVSKHFCNNCRLIFFFRNLLFKHLRQQYWNKFSSIDHVFVVFTLSIATSIVVITSTIVIRFIVISNKSKNNINYVFRNWHYVIVKLKLTTNSIISKLIIDEQKICFDFEYFVTLTNHVFMKNQFDNDMRIQQLISSLFVREINDKVMKINDFVVTQLYIDDVDAIK